MARQKNRTDPQPRICAVVHTVGCMTNSGVYVPVEFAYTDCTGLEKHFLVISTRDDHSIIYPSCSSLIVTKQQVYGFLQNRFKILAKKFGHSRTFFGYKGLPNHLKILSEAGIPNLANLDYFGVKKLQALDPEYGGTNCCPHHFEGRGKCALSAVRLMAPIAFTKPKEESNNNEPNEPNVKNVEYKLQTRIDLDVVEKGQVEIKNNFWLSDILKSLVQKIGLYK